MSSITASRLSDVAKVAECLAAEIFVDWNLRGRATLNGLGADDFGFLVAQRCSRYYAPDFIPSKPLVRKMVKNLMYDEWAAQGRRELGSRLDSLPALVKARGGGLGYAQAGLSHDKASSEVDIIAEHCISIGEGRFREGTIERRTFDLMRAGIVKPRDIADDLRVPRKAVYNAIQKIRKFLTSRPLPCALPRYW